MRIGAQKLLAACHDGQGRDDGTAPVRPTLGVWA